MAISGIAVAGRPFALWPATLQMTPSGVLDSAFGRHFVGVALKNSSAQGWGAAEVRVSARGRQTLAAASISISDSWSLGDAAAVGQTMNGDWVVLPALGAGASYLAFFKLDVSRAAPGSHTLELELRETATPQTRYYVSAPVFVAQTSFQGTQGAFKSVCDTGTLTTSLSSLSLDPEVYRRLTARVRTVAGTPAPGVRTPVETERLRLRLKALLCGEESDVCSVLADLDTSCALPTPAAPGPAPATGLGALVIFSTQATTLGDRTMISDGSVGSNGPVTIGNDGVINTHIVAGGDVQIGDRTRIQGNVTTAGVIRRTASGGSAISGIAKERASYTTVSIPTKTISPGGTNVTVPNDATQTINPGAYAVVTLRARSKVTFTAGLYQVTQLIIEPDVTLTLNQAGGAIDVRVRDSLSFGDRLILKAGAATAAGALAQFYSNQTSEVRVGTDIALFPIALSAPQGTIHVYSRTNAVGSLVAKTVVLEPDVGVARSPSDDWLGTGSSGLEFLGYPTGLSYSVAYSNGYFGSVGPLAFGQVPWKALLANAILLLDLGLPGGIAAELVSLARRSVVGVVKTSVLNALSAAPGSAPPPTQAGSVDAAVAKVTADRALGYPLFTYMDVSPGEQNQTPISSLGGTIATPGTHLTNAELSSILASGASDPDGLKVYKSGSGTGVTRGVISALVPVSVRDDETGTLHFVNQLLVVADPQSPAAGGNFASAGDSGSIWIQTRSNKIVGLMHSAGSSGALVSRAEDVVNALQIQFA